MCCAKGERLRPELDVLPLPLFEALATAVGPGRSATEQAAETEQPNTAHGKWPSVGAVWKSDYRGSEQENPETGARTQRPDRVPFLAARFSG